MLIQGLRHLLSGIRFALVALLLSSATVRGQDLPRPDAPLGYQPMPFYTVPETDQAVAPQPTTGLPPAQPGSEFPGAGAQPDETADAAAAVGVPAELRAMDAATPTPVGENIQEKSAGPRGDTTSQPISHTASALLREALAAPLPSDLLPSGEQLPLLVVIQRAGPAQQLPAVHAYWRASIAQAELYFAEQQLQQLTALLDPVDPEAAAPLAAIRAQAQARRARAILELVDARARLAELSNLPLLGELPLTKDLPLVGPYRTQFESLVARRPLPLSLHRIHRLLPYQLRLLEAHAEGVARTQQSLEVLVARHAAGGLSVPELARTQQQYQEQQQQFLLAVHTYNEQIASYALEVGGPGLTASTVVSMLVEVETAEAADAERSVLLSDEGAVQPASAIAPVRLPGNQPPADWAPRQPW